MNTFVIYPETKDQEKAVKAFLEALNITFEQKKEKDFWQDLPDHVKEGIKTGQEQAKKGLLTPHNEVMKGYDKYL